MVLYLADATRPEAWHGELLASSAAPIDLWPVYNRIIDLTALASLFPRQGVVDAWRSDGYSAAMLAYRDQLKGNRQNCIDTLKSLPAEAVYTILFRGEPGKSSMMPVWDGMLKRYAPSMYRGKNVEFKKFCTVQYKGNEDTILDVNGTLCKLESISEWVAMKDLTLLAHVDLAVRAMFEAQGKELASERAIMAWLNWRREYPESLWWRYEGKNKFLEEQLDGSRFKVLALTDSRWCGVRTEQGQFFMYVDIDDIRVVGDEPDDSSF